MLNAFKRERIPLWQAVRRGFAPRTAIEKAIKDGRLRTTQAENGGLLLEVSSLEALFGNPRGNIYGMHWGDPEAVPPLVFVRRHYIMPHVKPEATGLEIGPGGGRWTQYLKAMKKLYVVDYHQEMLDEVVAQFGAPNIIPILNNGSDFPGVGDGEIDFLMSYDVFVHLDPPIIASYLKNMRRVLKKDGVALIHYSDKTKIMAELNVAFVDTNAESMRKMVRDAGYRITLEDNTSIWHSNVMMFSRAD